MTSRQKLTRHLASRSDAFEARNHADAPIAIAPSRTTLMAAQGNPQFTAQFDLTLNLLFFTVAAGVYTAITPAALLAAQPTLATKFPAFVFGNSDYEGGFVRLQSAFPLNTWLYDIPFINGQGSQPGTLFGTLDATARGLLRRGDLVQPYTAVLGGVNYVAMSVIRCNQVAYGTLLGALSSDMFVLNMIRYIMSDTTATGLAQYANNVNIFKQSLFGKYDADFVSPNSFKLPEQMQNGVIDIPVQVGIDKQLALATDQNYNTPLVQWSLFVAMVNKLAY